MDSSIVETKLSDGSAVYAVVFIDGSLKVVIEVIDYMSAEQLQNALADHASYFTIEPATFAEVTG